MCGRIIATILLFVLSMKVQRCYQYLRAVAIDNNDGVRALTGSNDTDTAPAAKKAQLPYVVADEVPANHSYRFFLSAMVMLRDEEDMVLEFIKHYLEEGIDHFFIYDDNSKDRTVSMIRSCIDPSYYTILNYKSLGTKYQKSIGQIEVYRRMYQKIRHSSEWMVLVDVDELITSRSSPGRTIREFLEDELSACAAVSVPWLLFSWGNHSVTPRHRIRESLQYRWGYDPLYGRERNETLMRLQRKEYEATVRKRAPRNSTGRFQRNKKRRSPRIRQRVERKRVKRTKLQKPQIRTKVRKRRRGPDMIREVAHALGTTVLRMIGRPLDDDVDASSERRRLGDNKFRNRHTAVENKVIFRTKMVSVVDRPHHVGFEIYSNTTQNSSSLFQQFRKQYPDLLMVRQNISNGQWMQLRNAFSKLTGNSGSISNRSPRSRAKGRVIKDWNRSFLKNNSKFHLNRRLIDLPSEHRMGMNMSNDVGLMINISKTLTAKKVIPWNGLICIPHVDYRLACDKERDVMIAALDLPVDSSNLQDTNESHSWRERYVNLSIAEGDELAVGMCPRRTRFVNTKSLPRTTIREADIDKLQLAAFHYRVKSELDWRRKSNLAGRAFAADYVLSGRDRANRLDVYDDFMAVHREPAFASRQTMRWQQIQNMYARCQIFQEHDVTFHAIMDVTSNISEADPNR